MSLTVLDLFSGIGGFSLGLERTGHFRTVAFCEIDPYCQKVLAKHWPGVPIYDDISQIAYDEYTVRAGCVTDGTTAVGPIDVITAGFPCQDISHAGKQAGIDGERSGLWSELARIIGEVRPRYAVLENVAALLSGDRGRWFQRVLGDLAEIGYDCEWHCIPASAVGAPHRRDRAWIIAYPECTTSKQRFEPDLQRRWESEAKQTGVGSSSKLADTNQQGLEGRLRQVMRERTRKRAVGQSSDPWDGNWFAEPSICRVANGIPRRVDRLRGLGNAIVPQIAEIIGRAIYESYKA